MTNREEFLHQPDIPLPARQLAAALLAVDPSFSAETYSNQDYPELRKLQGKFLLPRKSARTAAVESRLRSNNMFNMIYIPEWQEHRSPCLVGCDPEVRSPDHVAVRVPNRLQEPTTHSPSLAPCSYDPFLRQRGRPLRYPYPEVSA